MPASFYVPDGDRFVSTEWTSGPWDPRAQHGGPPSALVARAIEALEPRMRVARFTFEFLRPIPVAPLRVEAAIVRPGNRVQMAEATLRDDAGEPVARARAWRIDAGTDVPEIGLDDPVPHPGPEAADPMPTPEAAAGYSRAMEWRFVKGLFTEPGPAAAWMRMRYPLVPGEEPSPLQRVLCAADSGNGISAAISWKRNVFINPELTVHLVRDAEGEHVLVDAETWVGPNGVGLARSVLWDRRGRIGTGTQALLVAPR